MKKYIVLAIILVGIFPAILFEFIGHSNPNRSETGNTFVSASALSPKTSEGVKRIQMIRIKDDERIIQMDLEEYVLCVVLGEMPASFEPEALKAQAVATRTYSLRKVLAQTKHSDANLCTDASCCQAFVFRQDYLNSKGNMDDLQKIEKAVRDTAGQVLTYDNKLIEATYFSCSGGMTEDAAAVWGTSVPYLKAVASPGEDHAGYFESEVSISKDAFLSALGLPSSMHLDESRIIYTKTVGNGVDTMIISGRTYSGTELRKQLGLPSTAFTIDIQADNVIITTNGYGHRVGLSQYGADAMAVNGSNYEKILMHYYQGASLVTLSERQMKAIFDKEWIL